jgi:hypothetical protein
LYPRRGIHRWGWTITLNPDGTTTATHPTQPWRTLHSHPQPAAAQSRSRTQIISGTGLATWGCDNDRMLEPRLVVAEDHVVALDNGQLHLLQLSASDEPIDYYQVVVRASESDGIAQVPGLLLVLSPHQSNFEMSLRVEVWDGPPPDDAAEWPEGFEAHLDVAEDGLIYDSPPGGGVHQVPLRVPPCAYHALITGRGFIANGWPGSIAPGDSWRIRLWPSTGPQAPRRLSAWRPVSR